MKLKAIKHTCIYRYLLAGLSLEKKNTKQKRKTKHELVERKETNYI